MNKFSQGRVGAAGTDETPALEIINPSTTKAAFLKAITLNLIAATATDVGLGRPAAAGITPTSPLVVLAENGRDTGVVTTAVAWATAPTIPAAYYRIGATAAAVGNEIKFEFKGQGLRIPAGGTVVLWNRTTSSQLNISLEVDQETETVVNS